MCAWQSVIFMQESYFFKLLKIVALNEYNMPVRFLAYNVSFNINTEGKFNLLSSFITSRRQDRDQCMHSLSFFANFMQIKWQKMSIILFHYSIMPSTIIVSLSLLQTIWCTCFSIFCKYHFPKSNSTTIQVLSNKRKKLVF